MYYHFFYRELYFLPLILSAIWFGIRGAVFTSVAVNVFYVPFVLINWTGFSPNDFDQIMVILLFFLIPLILGYLSNREKASQKALHESEALALLGSTVSGIAHDMKAPLVAIGGYSRSIIKKIAEDDPNREKLDIIIKETKRLENLANNMLVYSRPLKLNLIQGDLNHLIRECEMVVQEMAREKNIKIEILLSENIPLLAFDPSEMNRVFLNLIANAIQASYEDETVTIQTYAETGQVVVEVADNGPGIPPEIHEKIFSPFFTTKEEGTGLGLSIVAKIVKAHDGSVVIKSYQDKGVVFKISLPFINSP
jgi:signal transduction histidine kinase